MSSRSLAVLGLLVLAAPALGAPGVHRVSLDEGGGRLLDLRRLVTTRDGGAFLAVHWRNRDVTLGQLEARSSAWGWAAAKRRRCWPSRPPK